MKKLVLVLVVLVMFVAPVLTSCTDPSDEIVANEKNINHDEVGDDIDDDQQEGN